MAKEEIGFVEGFLIGLFIACFIFLIIITTIFPQFPISELDLDKDKIASYHVLQYYPEYENCTIKYISPFENNCEFKRDESKGENK